MELVTFFLQCIGEQLLLPLVAVVAAKADEVRTQTVALRRVLQESRSLARRTSDGVLPWTCVTDLLVSLSKASTPRFTALASVASRSLATLPSAVQGLMAASTGYAAAAAAAVGLVLCC